LGTKKRHMRAIVTGNQGYIGSVLTDVLAEHGHDVIGIDSGAFRDVSFVPKKNDVPNQIYKDIREITADDLKGADAVIHLAALSNDPLGALNPSVTFDINHRAAVRLAELAKQAGVARFLFSSSCSMYGVAGNAPVTEDASFAPQSAYAEAKVLAERDITKLTDESFAPIFLRNATVFGISPRMRLDLVVQNLAAYGYLDNVITILSDGLPWRPLVHVEDVARAFSFLLEAPRERVAAQAFNVGRNDNNLQIKTIAEMVREIIPRTTVSVKNEHPSDSRSYQVDFSKLHNLGFAPQWTVPEGIEDIYKTYQAINFTRDHFTSDAYITLSRYQTLMKQGRMDADLRIR